MNENIPKIYDLCVIGCGVAGFAAAMRALDLKKHVCIVESGEIGGAGVRWGALASKTLWELAKDYAIANKKDRGYDATGLRIDYSSVRNTVLEAVRERQQQMISQIEAFSPSQKQGAGSLTLKRGMGAFKSFNMVEISYPNGRREEISPKFVLISTGSSPRRIPEVPVDQERVLDSDGILNLKRFPKRLMIIGAGIVGCEYATIFSNFGQTKVYLVDHMDRILPYEDDDVIDFVQRNLKNNGVNVLHSAELKKVTTKSDSVAVTLEFAQRSTKVFEVDAILISVGRSPNISQLNLSALSLDADPKKDLFSDVNCCVKNNIYCAGDVSAHPDLVNVAEMEARHAVEHMFGVAQKPLKYRNMSTVMFFYPAVGAVGYNEKTCQEKNILYRVAYYSNALLPRAIAMRAVNGFVKIIVSDDDDKMILGMRAAGPQVSSMMVSISYLMDQEKAITDVLKTIHPHPTMSEGIQECIRVLLGTSIYKPKSFQELIKVRTWNPGRGYVY